jgi:hypothetical protein
MESSIPLAGKEKLVFRFDGSKTVPTFDAQLLLHTPILDETHSQINNSYNFS